MKRTPQRSLLLFWLIALAWGGGMAAIAWVSPAQPALLLTAWSAGAALLLLLALYLGLSFRLDLLQVQQALREASADPQAGEAGKSALAPLWWPLIEAAAAQQPAGKIQPAPGADCINTQSKAQIDLLQTALAAERAQISVWQQKTAQAQAELGLLRRQVQDAAQALLPVESVLATVTLLPHPAPAAVEPQQDQSEALGALAVTLAGLTAEFATQVHAANQQEAAAAAQAQARGAQHAQAVATLCHRAGQLRQAVDDLQLFGLNLRLQLSHFADTPGVDVAVFRQAEADLDALLGGLQSLSADDLSSHPATDTAEPPVPEPFPQVGARLLAHLQLASAQINAAGQDLAQRSARLAQARAQWHAAAEQQIQQLASLPELLQRLRSALQQAAQKNS